MIPYIHLPDANLGQWLHLPGSLGALSIHPFGVLVALGVTIGVSLATKRARQRGLDLAELNSFLGWILGMGFLGGHMLDEIFYHPAEVVQRPWSLLFLWEGLSSFGGFTGALIGAIFWKYLKAAEPLRLGPFQLPRWNRRPVPAPMLPWADLILSIFPVAWIFGRGGCSVVHDHKGGVAPMDAWYAVAYPVNEPGFTRHGWLSDGETVKRIGPEGFEAALVQGLDPRFDLGLLEWGFTVVLAIIFALTWHKKLPAGFYVVAASLSYAPARFVMDYFRLEDGQGNTGDMRYGGMTPAQWECIALFALGLVVWGVCARMAKRGEDPYEAFMADAPISTPVPVEQDLNPGV